jgi:alpha-D-xyloside xylohydrolase
MRVRGFLRRQDSQVYSYSYGGDVSIPFYTSSVGYAFVWNSPSYGFVNLTASALQWYSNATLNADVWVTATRSPMVSPSPYLDLLASVVDVMGHAPVMPFYATGFIQCKNRYRNQSQVCVCAVVPVHLAVPEHLSLSAVPVLVNSTVHGADTQVLDVSREYVARGLPISVIVIDYHHWNNMGDWSFKQYCWPDPQGELACLSPSPRHPPSTAHLRVYSSLPLSLSPSLPACLPACLPPSFLPPVRVTRLSG